MPRPNFITENDLLRWDQNIDSDPMMPLSLSSNETLREVCYSGLWLAEELSKLECSESMITSIQFSAGRLSFGRDPWDVSLMLLEAYQNNELVFEDS